MKQHRYIEYKTKECDIGREVLSVMQEEMELTNAKIRSVKFIDYGILLDGIRVGVREKLKDNQILQVLLDDVEEEQSILANPMELEIVYEDENLIFLNKPSGMVCHPAQGHLTDTLVNGVKAYFDETQPFSRIHLIGRLDKDTSGIVAIAKNKVAAERLHFEKTYDALVEGELSPTTGLIEYPMEESFVGEELRQLKMIIGASSHAKMAKTSYRLVSVNQMNIENKQLTYSHCKVQIETGRTHQIRFHMAQLGFPLLGDSLYGNGVVGNLRRAALHAGKVAFSHPMTKEDMVLEVMPPEDMMDFL